MPNSIKKKSLNINKDLFERFEYLYPRLTSVFVNRSLELALQDKEYFEKVFFNPYFKEVK